MSASSSAPILLIGMMGSGKSTVAPLVAERLNCPAYDLDDEIVRRSGRSIAEIFAGDGEVAFREWERATLTDLMQAEGLRVIALGGGALTQPATRTLAGLGWIVWLDANPAMLWRRVAGTDRPLAQEGLDAFVRRYRERYRVYRQMAGMRIDVGGLAPAQVADVIVDAWQRRSEKG